MLILLRIHPYHSSWLLNHIKRLEVLESAAQSVSYEEVCYTPKELLSFLISKKSWGHVWKLMQGIWDSNERNAMQDQSKFMHVGLPSRNSGFHIEAL